MSSDSSAPPPQPPRVSAVPLAAEAEPPALPLHVALGIDQPQWLHPSSIVFDVLAQVRRHIFPVLFAGVGAASGGFHWIVIGIVIFAFSMAFTVMRYVTLRYRITDGDLIVTEGLVFRRIRTVPVRRIQNIDLNQNLLHRALNVAEVRIETASGSEPESVLRVLSLEQVDRLRQAIFRNQAAAQSDSPQLAVQTDSPSMAGSAGDTTAAGNGAADYAVVIGARSATQGVTVLHISTRWLILAGLCSNRGMVVATFLLGWLVQSERWRSREALNELWGFVPQGFGWATNIAVVVFSLLVATMLLRIFSCAWYVMKFYGYRLERYGDDLRIACGLFTKVSATIPRQRIQLISVHRPLFFRWMGLASIRVETAGGSSSDDDSVSSVGRQWFVPVVDAVEIPRLLSELRPGWSWNADSQEWRGTSPRTPSRLRRMAMLLALAASGLGAALWPPWGIGFGLALLPLLFWHAHKQSRALRYAPADFGVAFRSGILTHKLSFTFYERLQTLRFDQSPLDRRWRMATLSLDTAGAGPADHRIDIPYLDEAFARTELERLRAAASRHIPRWA